jgi:hypothetical protein
MMTPNAPCATRWAAAAGQLHAKIRCAQGSLEGFGLSEVRHDHSVSATSSGMFRAVVTAIAAYDHDSDPV